VERGSAQPIDFVHLHTKIGPDLFTLIQPPAQWLHRPRGNPGPDRGSGEGGGTGSVARRWRGWVMSPEDRALTEVAR
jgi:hypothetical protein